MKDYAKQLKKQYKSMREYLDCPFWDYAEDIMLFGFLLAGEKMTDQERLPYLQIYVSHITSWAVCDSPVSSYKFIGKNPDFYKPVIRSYLTSDKEYEVRFAVVALMDYYINDAEIDGVLSDIKKGSPREGHKKQALTETQQAAFMQFVANSVRYRQWGPLFAVMLGTGCRVGEIIGLRWEDCDFAEETISINHSLLYRQKEPRGACEFMVSTPKTETGIRVIPMATEVKRALEQERQFQTEVCPANIIIDGYSNFIFTSQTGGVLSPHTVNRAIERIRTAYNSQETELANQEQREPQLLPHFSAHTLRHTFCARFCEHETNLKVIQEIMGRASITTTMDVYNHVTLEQKIASFKRLGETYKII